MEIIKCSLGVYQANCYILKKEGNVVIIDPGANVPKIQSLLNEKDHVSAILLTHGHFDHIGAVDELVSLYQCSVYVSADELEIIQDPIKNYALNKKVKVSSKVISFTDHLKINDFEFIIHETPGHTIGSVCLEIEGHLFSGDTLFKGSVGRTDLYSSSSNQLKQSLKYLKTLSPDLKVHPGHENSTTLEHEIKNNPYFK